MVNNKLKLVKSATAFVIGATLLTGSFAAAGSDTAFAKSSSSVKESKGKLVYKSTGKVVKGYKTYNKALYKDGKKLTGLYKKTYYKAGKKATGTYKSVYYKSGKAFTGVTNKTYYNAGKKATGTYKNVYYKSGKAYTGVVNKTYYKAGKKATGLYKGVYYKTGKAATGIYKDQLYVSGNLSKGLELYKEQLYKDGSLNQGLAVYKEQLYKDAALNKGLALFQDQLYKDAVLNKGLVKFEDKFYFDATIANGTYVDADNVERAIENGIEVGAKVKAVEAINGTELKVTFNKTVDKNTISVDDFTFKALDTATNNSITTTSGSANVDGALSSDGKTYTITTNNGTSVFSGRYDVAVAAGSIKTKANEGFAKYAETLTFSDKTAASISSVTTKATDATTADVVIEFNEQVKDAGTLTVNGKSYTATGFKAGDTKATFASVKVDASKSYPAELVGTTDVAGNIGGTISTTVSSVEDTIAPTVAISAKQSTITLKFSEQLKAAPTVTVNGSTIAANPDATDATKTTYTVDASTLLTGTTFLNNAAVVVSAFADASNNAGKTTNATVNLTTDTTAPTLLSKELVNNELVLKFDETVKDAAGVVDVTGLKLSFVDADGVVTPLTGTTLTGAKGKDLNGNGKIDTNTDEEKYVVVSFADSKNQILDTKGNLVNGNYTFSWAKGGFTDAAGNEVAAGSFTLSPKTSSSTSATVTYDTKATVSGLTLKNTQILVTYNEVMSSSATAVENYKLAGAALPTNTTAVFYGDKQHVLITLPQGSIASNGTRTLIASNVTSAAGNTIADTQTTQSVDLKESVLPTFSSVLVNSANQATATFSEDLKDNAAPKGVTVKVDGVEDKAAKVEAKGGKLVITTGVSLTSSSKVTLVFASTDLADANDNTVADN
ncbi:hypothetical protein ACQKM9_00810 [Viridibacillus sp. NPDC093762]|uniref:hypothetical protein n=1 Tax=Viridibacillus sp. NPDC093762 TaxID=3390720 RepID=UPI003D05A2FD